MSNELTQTVKDQILAMRGQPVRLIASKLGVGKSAVASVLAEPAEPEQVSVPAAPSAVSAPVDLSDPAAIKSFAERAASLAERDGNVAAMVSAGRLASGAVMEERKAAPPVPVDPDAMPNMLAAAERCKAELRKSLDRIAAEIAELPK